MQLTQTVDVAPDEVKLSSQPLVIAPTKETLAPLKIVLEGLWRKPFMRERSAPNQQALDNADGPDETKWNNLSKYNTAGVFVQFALCGDGARYAPNFMEFARRAGRERVTEKLFKECFGMTYAKMDRLLWTFATNISVYRTSGYRGRPKFPPYEDREATQTEIACLKALNYQAGGQPDRALETVRVAYMRGERTLRLLAELAYWEARHGSLEKARKLVAWLKGKTLTTDRALLAQIYLLLHDARAAPGKGGKLKRDDTLTLLTYVGSVTKMQPRQTEEISELGAGIVLESEGRPAGAIVTFLQNSARLYPTNEKIRKALDLAKTGAAE